MFVGMFIKFMQSDSVKTVCLSLSLDTAMYHRNHFTDSSIRNAGYNCRLNVTPKFV